MSNQADALNKVALEAGLIPAPAPGVVLDAEGQPADRPELPWILLPGDGRSGVDFHTEMGMQLRERGLYRYKGRLVTVAVDETTGRAEIEDMDAHRFRDWVEHYLVCFKMFFPRKGGAIKERQMMGVDMANTCLAADSFKRQLPRLLRVNYVRLPIIRKNGALEMLPAGFDAETGIFTIPPEWEYDEAMTAIEGLTILEELIEEFDFQDTRSRSIFFASLFSMYGFFLQPIASRRVNFLFHSNAERSGKTLLVEIILTIAFRWASVDSLPEDASKLRDRLDTAVREAKPYLVFDDLDKTFLRSGLLNAFMTATFWSGRKFHAQEEFEQAKLAVIFMTANNLEVTADIAGRTLICDLVSVEADAQAKKIKRPIDAEYIRQPAMHRQLCSALWALLREWYARRSEVPAPPRPLKGYEAWSRMYGGMVKAFGLGDPFEQRKVEGSGNTEYDDMQALMEKLAHDVKKSHEWTFVDIVQEARALNCFPHIIERHGHLRRIRGKGEEEDRLEFELSGTGNSLLGLLLGKFGGKGFTLKDGRRAVFDKRGKNRHRRYLIQVSAAAS